MEPTSQIEHEGIVVKTGPDRVTVKMIVKSACASCQVKAACNLAETEEKIVEVKTGRNQFIVGQRVTVGMKKRQGYRALLLGYLFPFVILVFFLILFQKLGFSDGWSALWAFSLLSLYYFILYLTRKKLDKKFSYSVSALE